MLCRYMLTWPELLLVLGLLRVGGGDVVPGIQKTPKQRKYCVAGKDTGQHTDTQWYVFCFLFFLRLI